MAPWATKVKVPHEGSIAGRDATRGFESQSEMKERVSDKAAGVSLVTTATRRGNAAQTETNEETVSCARRRLIAATLQGARVSPETARAMGRRRYGTRGSVKSRGIVPGFKSREREIREEAMLQIRFLRHVRSRSAVLLRGRLSRRLTISSSAASASECAATRGQIARPKV
jgi:hypothetical protein